jgi:hypothetical protein
MLVTHDKSGVIAHLPALLHDLLRVLFLTFPITSTAWLYDHWPDDAKGQAFRD